jgi:hypothetical protein
MAKVATDSETTQSTIARPSQWEATQILPRRKEKVMGEEFGALVLSLSWPLLEILGSAERTGTQGQ